MLSNDLLLSALYRYNKIFRDMELFVKATHKIAGDVRVIYSSNKTHLLYNIVICFEDLRLKELQRETSDS